jgi:hypothetical protein
VTPSFATLTPSERSILGINKDAASALAYSLSADGFVVNTSSAKYSFNFFDGTGTSFYPVNANFVLDVANGSTIVTARDEDGYLLFDVNSDGSIDVESLLSIDTSIGVNFSAFRGLDLTSPRIVFATVCGHRAGNVIGSSLYREDSSLSSSAVHAGVVQDGSCSTVQVIVKSPNVPYVGSVSHNLQSVAGVNGSGMIAFSFNSSLIAAEAAPAPMDYGSSLHVLTFKGLNDSGLRVIGGSSGYAMSSELRAAAVHAGVLTVGQVASVCVNSSRVNSTYFFNSSLSNTVQSESFNLSDTSAPMFSFCNVSLASVIASNSSNGSIALLAAVGSVSGVVVGSGPFSVSSDVATAAVHYGVLGVGVPGIVRIQILKGACALLGSLAHNINSSSENVTDCFVFLPHGLTAPLAVAIRSNGKVSSFPSGKPLSLALASDQFLFNRAFSQYNLSSVFSSATGGTRSRWSIFDLSFTPFLRYSNSSNALTLAIDGISFALSGNSTAAMSMMSAALSLLQPTAVLNESRFGYAGTSKTADMASILFGLELLSFIGDTSQDLFDHSVSLRQSLLLARHSLGGWPSQLMGGSSDAEATALSALSLGTGSHFVFDAARSSCLTCGFRLSGGFSVAVENGTIPSSVAAHVSFSSPDAAVILVSLIARINDGFAGVCFSMELLDNATGSVLQSRLFGASNSSHQEWSLFAIATNTSAGDFSVIVKWLACGVSFGSIRVHRCFISLISLC